MFEPKTISLPGKQFGSLNVIKRYTKLYKLTSSPESPSFEDIIFCQNTKWQGKC